MTLSPYHKKFLNKPDADIKKRADVKEKELSAIFKQLAYKPTGDRTPESITKVIDEILPGKGRAERLLDGVENLRKLVDAQQKE